MAHYSPLIVFYGFNLRASQRGVHLEELALSVILHFKTASREALIKHTFAAATLVGSANAALVGHWEFDGDLTDSVGPNNVSAIGDDAAGAIKSKIRCAIAFDGSGDVATISSRVISGTEFSLSFWAFSPTATASNADGYFLAGGTGSGLTIYSCGTDRAAPFTTA